MEKHSEIGERILAKVEDYAEIAQIVRHHHERWDGQGYPDGLDTEDIPLVARIIAAADAYNAMTSDRPYRDAMPSRVARLVSPRVRSRNSTPRSSRHSKLSLLGRARITGSRPVATSRSRSKTAIGSSTRRGSWLFQQLSLPDYRSSAQTTASVLIEH